MQADEKTIQELKDRVQATPKGLVKDRLAEELKLRRWILSLRHEGDRWFARGNHRYGLEAHEEARQKSEELKQFLASAQATSEQSDVQGANDAASDRRVLD